MSRKTETWAQKNLEWYRDGYIAFNEAREKMKNNGMEYEEIDSILMGLYDAVSSEFC